MLWRSYHSSRIPSTANQGRGDNYARYSNPDVDAWLNEAASTANSERQHDLLCKVTAQINKDIPVIYLYERLLVSGYRTRLQNLQLSPGPGNFTIGSENWWVTP
jgi:peptide/nickel transport system substrate-binding protein